MAVTLSGMTTHDDADTVTNWSGWDGLDTYGESVQGTNSYSILVRKNSTDIGVLTKAASLPARGVVIGWLKSDIAKFYSSVDITLGDGTNTLNYQVANITNQAVNGKWNAFALDYVNKGTGSLTPANFNSYTITIVSQNLSFRAVTNNWADAVSFGKGHTITGTTTLDKAFYEAWDYEWNTDTRRWGVLENFNGIIFSQADIDMAGTLTSNQEVLVFADTPTGYDVYEFDVTGTVDLINTSILTAGTKLFDFDSTGATSFSMEGGSLEGCNTLNFGATDTVDGVVISNGNTINIANNITNTSFVNNGIVVITGTLSGCSIIPAAGSSVACSAATLDQLGNCSFTGDGSGHAVDLGTVSASTTMNWGCNFTGYGADGTANAVINVNYTDTANPLTINVGPTADTPTVNNTGAGTVNVVSGQVTLTLTGIKAGSDVVILQQGTTTKLVDEQDIVGTTHPYTYTYSAGTYIDIAVYATGYVPYFVRGYLLGSSSTSLPIAQTADRNYTP